MQYFTQTPILMHRIIGEKSYIAPLECNFDDARLFFSFSSSFLFLTSRLMSSFLFLLRSLATAANDLGQRSPSLLVRQLHLAKVLVKVEDDLQRVPAAGKGARVQLL